MIVASLYTSFPRLTFRCYSSFRRMFVASRSLRSAIPSFVKMGRTPGREKTLVFAQRSKNIEIENRSFGLRRSRILAHNRLAKRTLCYGGPKTTGGFLLSAARPLDGAAGRSPLTSSK